ncbi:MAG TPA: hypothetical protein PKI94_07105 [Candidatus Gastranaerophilaceae bacterium]|nr:hypothetical protein [Candidatus Gastranaerophilaceae bacterium]
MITQVSGLDSVSVAKDPRRKAQSIKFKHPCSNISYKSGEYRDVYTHQKNEALLTSISIVAGSTLFILGSFLFMALKKVKP